MGANQDPMAPQQPASQQPAAQPPPSQPSGPSALDTLMASMSRTELLVLAGGALIVLVDVIFWFISGYGVNHGFFVFAALGALLVLGRKGLPSGVTAIYWALLFVIALIVTLLGARNFILDVLILLRPPMGATPAFLLGMIGTAVGTAAMAYATFMMWRGRQA